MPSAKAHKDKEEMRKLGVEESKKMFNQRNSYQRKITRKQFIAWSTLASVSFSALGDASFSKTASAVASDKQREFTFVDEGKPEAVIIWWSESDSPVPTFAASQLQDYLKKMSGAETPILKGVVNHSFESKGFCSALIVVTGAEAIKYKHRKNRTAAIPKGWLDPVISRLIKTREDSFIIYTNSNRLILSGVGCRGTLYATYELLQRLGVRFFAPNFDFYQGNNEYIPQKRSVAAILPTAIVEEPRLQYRKKYVEEGWSYNPTKLVQLADWMSKNRFNILVYPYDYQAEGLVRWDDWRTQLIPEFQKRGILIEVGGHGYQSFLPRSEYPQYYTSGTNVFDVQNDEAVQEYVDQVINYLQKRPEIHIFDAWPPDGARWPQAAIEKYGSVANAEAHVVNTLNRAVHKQLPDVQVERIAYTNSIAPPDEEYMYDSSVLVDFSPFGRSYQVPIYDHSNLINAEYDGHLREWIASFNGPISIYEYYRKYAFNSLPVVLTHTIKNDLYYEADLGADGLGTYAEPADWITYEFVHLLTGKLSWNSGIDVDEYLNNYLKERYGTKVSAYLHRYFSLVEETGEILFNPNSFDDLNTVTRARENYIAARRILTRAADIVTSGSSAHFMIQRLLYNLSYALSYIDVYHYSLLGEKNQEMMARDRVRQIVWDHVFDGVVLLRFSVLNIFGSNLSKAAMLEIYRNEPWAGLLQITAQPLAAPGIQTEVVGRFTNKGSALASNVQLKLHIPDGWKVVPDNTVEVGNVAVNDSNVAVWHVEPPSVVDPGNYEVFAEATYTYKGVRASVRSAPSTLTVPERPVTAQPMTSMGTYDGYTIDRMVDDDASTFWWSNRRPLEGDYVGVDLSHVRQIDKIEILMASTSGPAPRPEDYIHNGVVEVSDDGSHWRDLTTVHNQPEIKMEVPKGTFARFVRLKATQLSPAWVQVREFLVE